MGAGEAGDAGRWFAVARSEELVPRHIGQTELLGRELALWRDDAGAVNVWENRCPHRGVRLSLGSNDGRELRCRYHAWRFASGSGQCTHIPAHPTQRPAATLRVGVVGAAESQGFVWARLAAAAGDGSPQPPVLLRGPPDLAAATGLTLRSIYVEAPHALAARALHGYRFAVDPARDPRPADAMTTQADPFTLTAAVATDGGAVRVLFLLQPQSASRTVVHGCLLDAGADDAGGAGRADRSVLLRHHNAQLTAVRDALERAP